MPRLRLQFSSSKAIFRLQLAIIGVTATAAVLCVLVAADVVDHGVGSAGRHSQDALTVSNTEALLGDMLAILSPRASTYLASPAFASLDPSTQRVVRSDLLRVDGEAADPALPPTEVLLSLKDGVALQQDMDRLVAKTRPALEGRETIAARVTRAQLDQSVISLNAYLEEPTVTNFRLMRFNLVRLRDGSREIFPALSTEAEQSFGTLHHRVNTGRYLLVLGLLVMGASSFLMTLIMGKRLQAVLLASQSERESLSYRNSQLNALYVVFNEITDSLSMRYVVDATVRESRRIVDADAVVLRLVRQDELVVAASLSREGAPIAGLSTVQLGEGAVGRVARRGKTLRLGEGGDALTEGTWAAGMESGMVVPLIVGARVVGTLGCWARRPLAFSEDDQRVLEMMASQVATAVVAADSTEVNERRARLDPLTGLSNRRELDQDLAGSLAELAESGRSAVVVMLDVDHFKRFNDDYGHHVGDVTLQKVAAVMRNSLRESDRVYRYGGEEFVVVMVDADREQGLLLAERVRAAVASTPLTGEALEPVGPVTISMGLSLFPDHARDFGVLIALADEAMYQSKQCGRNQVTLWSAGMQKPAVAA